jgi:hypothetical protein
VAIEKPTFTLPAAGAALAAAAGLAAALALASDAAVLDELSLFEQPLNAAAVHNTSVAAGVPNFAHTSNLAEFQAITVSVL